MGEAATRFSDLTIITSDNPRQEDPMDIISEIETGIDGREVKKNEPDNLKLNEGGRIYTVIPERKKAIEAAINAAGKADIVLIAGKGHEDYQILGAEKTPFDDCIVARQILKSRSQLK